MWLEPRLIRAFDDVNCIDSEDQTYTMRACASLGFVRFLQAATASLPVHAEGCGGLYALYYSENLTEHVPRPLNMFTSRNSW